MGAALDRRVAPQTERAPASGVRPRVRPEDAFEAAPFSVVPPANEQTEDRLSTELALEDAVPFQGNAAIAAVFLFATSIAGGLVAVGLYL